MYAGYVKIMWSFAWMEHALGHSHYTCRQKIILILYRGLFSFTNAGEMSEVQCKEQFRRPPIIVIMVIT